MKDDDVKWVYLDGYDCQYKLSSNGDLIKCESIDTAGRRRKSIKIVPQYNTGFAVVRLLKNGEREPHRLSHLVAKHFLKCSMRRFFIRYIDGDIKNNSAKNLKPLPYSIIAKNACKANSKPVVFWRESTPDIIMAYDSIEDASRALNLSHTTLKYALDRTRGKVGVGQGKRSGDGYLGAYA